MIFGLIAASLFGRLEWGAGQKMFLFEGEWDILKRLFTDPRSVAHPFIVLPLLGQALLLIALFQRSPKSWLIYSGMGALTVLLGFMTFIGIISLNWRIFVSTLPFLALCAVAVIELRKR